jgi:AcrR family transcriptional regulator
MLQPKTDHRPRVAQLRRERTRQNILDVVQAHYPGVQGQPLTLDEVIRLCGISKGTFYKYFPSLEAAVSELGAELARQMIIDMGALYEPLSHPVARVAMGCQLFLYRAMSDSRWAAFISHIHNLSSENLLLRYIRGDLERGCAGAVFRIVSIDTVADFVLGITIEAARKIADGHGSDQMVREIVTLLLRALGADDTLALSAIDEAHQTLLRDGPDKLAWWSPAKD